MEKGRLRAYAQTAVLPECSTHEGEEGVIRKKGS